MSTSKDTPENGLQGEGAQEDVLVAQGQRAVIFDEASTAAEDTPKVTDSEEEEGTGGEPPRKYAGRYASIEDLESGYKSLQAELTKTKQEIANKQTKASTEVDDADSEIDPKVMQQLQPYLEKYAKPLVEDLQRDRVAREWDLLKAEYGDDVQGKIEEYFAALPVEEQALLNNPAGTRTIAKLLKAQGALKEQQRAKATQPAGSPRSHTPRGSDLTRQKILQMSPEEYASRQPEILAFYASLGQN